MDQTGSAWSNCAGRESIRSPVVRWHSTWNEAGAGRPIGATYADARSRRRATSVWVVWGNMSKRRPSTGRREGMAARSLASDAGLHEE